MEPYIDPISKYFWVVTLVLVCWAAYEILKTRKSTKKMLKLNNINRRHDD